MGARIERRSSTHTCTCTDTTARVHMELRPRGQSVFLTILHTYISCCYACEVSVGVRFEGGPVADAVVVSVL